MVYIRNRGYMITLGQFSSVTEGRAKIALHNRRLLSIIKLNKLRVSPSKFKFKLEKIKAKPWMGNIKMGYINYPYEAFVKTPNRRYDWIFLR